MGDKVDPHRFRIGNDAGFDALEPGEVPLLVEVIPDAEETKGFWKAWDTR